MVRLVWEALLLTEHSYGEMREQPNAALRGLVIVVLIGLIVPLLGLVGTALEWATTPDMGAVQDIVLEGLQEMPWYRQLQHEPQFRKEFQRWYDLGWRFSPWLFGAPNLASATSMIIILPLRLTTFLPYVIVGGVVGTWTLVCRYVALKACHRLSWGRTLATTLLPYIVFALVASLFGCLAGMVLGLIFGGGAS
jgi:hypothetical protein